VPEVPLCTCESGGCLEHDVESRWRRACAHLICRRSELVFLRRSWWGYLICECGI
jgi:hypothetical protein